MKFAIDTNILLPLEVASISAPSTHDPEALELNRIVQESGNHIVVHPAILIDLARDPDVARRERHTYLLNKYPKIVDPPPVTPAHEAHLGVAQANSNDWVDNLLLVAVERHAVDYLVTQDQKMHRKASRLGIADRVLTITDALATLRTLFDTSPIPPPAVRRVQLYNVDERDPIFDSFRGDYPGFDAWLRASKKRVRRTWTISGPNGRLAAICIVKKEGEDIPDGIGGRVLKICTFKVADQYAGFRFGELLLKTVFAYARDNKFDWAFVTVFERHELLTRLLYEFGFANHQGRSPLGELVLVKPLRPGLGEPPSGPLAYAVRYGPCHLAWDDSEAWVVPIQPRFDAVLFPDLQNQVHLFPGSTPFGNSIRKAYLCRSSVRQIKPGDVLAFYRSQTTKAITVLGVVEDSLVSDAAIALGSFVAKRTVYSMRDITDLCTDAGGRPRTVLAIKFRQVLRSFEHVPLHELKQNGLLKSAPQSITRIPREAIGWIQKRTEG